MESTDGCCRKVLILRSWDHLQKLTTVDYRGKCKLFLIGSLFLVAWDLSYFQKFREVDKKGEYLLFVKLQIEQKYDIQYVRWFKKCNLFYES